MPSYEPFCHRALPNNDGYVAERWLAPCGPMDACGPRTESVPMPHNPLSPLTALESSHLCSQPLFIPLIGYNLWIYYSDAGLWTIGIVVESVHLATMSADRELILFPCPIIPHLL